MCRHTHSSWLWVLHFYPLDLCITHHSADHLLVSLREERGNVEEQWYILARLGPSVLWPPKRTDTLQTQMFTGEATQGYPPEDAVVPSASGKLGWSGLSSLLYFQVWSVPVGMQKQGVGRVSFSLPLSGCATIISGYILTASPVLPAAPYPKHASPLFFCSHVPNPRNAVEKLFWGHQWLRTWEWLDVGTAAEHLHHRSSSLVCASKSGWVKHAW